MPRTRRDNLKKRIAQAHLHLDQAGVYLADLYEQFAPVHPEYAEYLLAMMSMIAQVMESCGYFWEKAWGNAPESYDGWVK